MNEKLMQDLLKNYPCELIEEGLKYVNREIGTGNRRLDLAFLDRRNRLLLIEVQKDSLDTKHIDRHIDFVEGFAEKNPNEDIRLMYIANRIDPLRKSFLERRGYEYMEISATKFNAIADKNNFTNEDEKFENQIPSDRFKISKTTFHLKLGTDMRLKFISQFYSENEKKFWNQFFAKVDERIFLDATFQVKDFGLRINNKHLKAGTKDYSLMFTRNGVFKMNKIGFGDGLNRLKNWCSTPDLPENFYSALRNKNLLTNVTEGEVIDISSLLKYKSPEQINNELFECIDLFQ